MANRSLHYVCEEQMAETTDIGQNRFDPPDLKTRKRRGIGDNSKNNSDRDLTATAQQQVFEFHRSMVSAIATTDRKGADVACSVYILSHALHVAGVDAQFRELHGIRDTAIRSGSISPSSPTFSGRFPSRT
jgi:hypothetical protein